MLETVDLSKIMLKEEYKAEMDPLKETLGNLQHEVRNAGLPVMIIFEGWNTAGKGSVLSDVILTLDPRNFKAKSTLPPNCEEQRKPFLWRHWRDIPAAGLMTLYDQSWYPEASTDVVEEKLPQKEVLFRLDAINLFERQMADNGTLIIKFFLHITQKEQKKRLDKLAAKKSTAWRVDKRDYQRNKQYNAYFRAYDQMLAATNTPHAPWHLVSGQDRRTALASVYRTIIASIQDALAQKAKAEKAKPKHNTQPLSGGPFTLLQMPALGEVILDKCLEKDDYQKDLKRVQKKLRELHNRVYLKKIPVIIVYEGWDAAGKGGNIKRLTTALDPRGYEVIPIAAPTPPEKARQYLWRFWTNLPKDGHIAIFDRSWYGRVMVERVEGFASEDAWRRAYREMNEFEAQLAAWGAIVLKFWLHIDKDEQLRRFEARQNTPEKSWKLTDEDWRNREKWDLYEQAVNDMLRLTSTDFAPWTIVESQNKYYARIKAIETTIAAIEARL